EQAEQEQAQHERSHPGEHHGDGAEGEEHREHGHVVGEPGRDGHDQVPRQHHARVHAGEQPAAGGVGGAQQLEAHPVDAEHVTGLAGHQRTSGWAESETAGPAKAGSEKAGPEKAVSETAVAETARSVQVALARAGPGSQARSSAAVRGSGSRPSSSAMRAACGGTSRACAVTPWWEKSSRGLTSASTAPWSSTSTRLAQVATSSMSW